MVSARATRILVTCLLGIAILVALWVLFFTSWGQGIRSEPREIGPRLTMWVRVHPIHVVLIFLVLYVVMTLLFLPVWSLQMFCGFTLSRILGFWPGMLLAIAICQITATVAAVISFLFSRWLAADWFHKKVEAKMGRIRKLDEQLGNNGFLLVMAVRLIHVMPFALSNYAFGLLPISIGDIVLGTLLGGIPGVTLYVVWGIHFHLLHDWRFVSSYMSLNVVLLIPVALRYLKPHWFRKIGVE
jgi:uncharacterized membrane protein YdjX (TVP38/TMEM64 family)